MKKRMAAILLGVLTSVTLFGGCGPNKATETANESEAEEKEGSGEKEEAEENENEEEAQTEAVNEEVEEPAEKVGVLLAAGEEDARFGADAEALGQRLEKDGFIPEIRFAGEDASVQLSQIEELMALEVSAMIIDPADPYGLTEILEEVKENSIPVFAYDDLIMNTDAVKYYVTFDTRKAGQIIGENIVKANELDKVRENQESRNIEFLMGAPDDSRALFFYNGVMEILEPYFADGTLVNQSQAAGFDETAVMRWSQSSAKARIRKILDEFYGEEQTLDILCTASDDFAYGVLEVFEEKEILPGSEEFPYITGMGCKAEAIKKIAAGEIACSIFMDNRVLGEKCGKMVNTYLSGKKPKVTDYEQYDNGIKIIGTYACEGELIDKDNYQMLIDNGYYTADEIEPEIPSENTGGDEAVVVTQTPGAEQEVPVTPTGEPEVKVEAEITATPEATVTPAGTKSIMDKIKL